MCDSDMYFHIFVLSDDQPSANIKSERPATVDAANRWEGEPVMDSQIVAAKSPLEAETA